MIPQVAARRSIVALYRGLKDPPIRKPPWKHSFETLCDFRFIFNAEKVRGSNIKPQKRNQSPSFSMENYELRYSVSSTNRPLTHSSISGMRPPGVVIKGYLILYDKKVHSSFPASKGKLSEVDRKCHFWVTFKIIFKTESVLKQPQ